MEWFKNSSNWVQYEERCINNPTYKWFNPPWCNAIKWFYYVLNNVGGVDSGDMIGADFANIANC